MRIAYLDCPAGIGGSWIVGAGIDTEADVAEEAEPERQCGPGSTAETVWMLETNLDDMSGELIGHCVRRLWALDPLDVWTTPIQMKKQRPGIVLSVLCRREQLERIESLLFRETTTLGIRRWPVERTVLKREPCLMSTPWGKIEAKRATLPDGTEKVAPEFESAKRLALEKGISVKDVYDGWQVTNAESE